MNLIGHYGTVRNELGSIIQRGCVRILDAKMIVEGGFSLTVDERQLSDPIKYPVVRLHQTSLIEEILGQIRKDGFGQHIIQLTGIFGSVMLLLTGTEKQQKDAQNWTEGGYIGCFLMTDAGGANLHEWRSEVIVDGDKRKLIIDKIHSMAADRSGFALVVVRKGTSFVPVTFLIDPMTCKRLEASPIGDAWLDGNLQLGNVRGEVFLNGEDQLKLGGLNGVNQFLTFCRPRLIRAIIAHLYWLADNQRVFFSELHLNALRNVEDLALAYTNRDYFTRDTVSEVLALKFVCNEFLLDIVCSESVQNIHDQRDILGFTKMEGSSYRCFNEIYRKHRENK
jgi:hypothetical protein